MQYAYLEKSIEIAQALRGLEPDKIMNGSNLGSGGSFDVLGIGSFVLGEDEVFLAAKLPVNDDEDSVRRLVFELSEASFIAHYAPSLADRLPLFFAHIEVPDSVTGALLTEDVSLGGTKPVSSICLPMEDKQIMTAGTEHLGMTYADFDTEPADDSLAFYVGGDIRYLDFTPNFTRNFLSREETRDVITSVNAAVSKGLLNVSSEPLQQ